MSLSIRAASAAQGARSLRALFRSSADRPNVRLFASKTPMDGTLGPKRKQHAASAAAVFDLCQRVGGAAYGMLSVCLSGDWKHHSLDISHLRCISQKCTPHVPHLIDLRLFCEAASPQHSHALSTRLNSIEHALSAEDLKSCCRVGSRAKATCPRLLTTCGWL